LTLTFFIERLQTFFFIFVTLFTFLTFLKYFLNVFYIYDFDRVQFVWHDTGEANKTFITFCVNTTTF